LYAAIDSDAEQSSTNLIIEGDTRYESITGASQFSTSTELHNIPAAYNVSTWGTGGSGTETSGEADTTTRGDGLAAAGTFDTDYGGDGDLFTVSVHDTTRGFVMEWDAGDSNAEFQGTYAGWLDSNTNYSNNDMRQLYDFTAWLGEQAEDQDYGMTFDHEYLPIGGLKTTYGWTNTNNNVKSLVEAYNLGNNVYIGGGFDHLDWVWDDSANAAFVAVNSDMDGANSSDAPTIADDHYLVIGADTDGDANLWEQGDVFDLDEISLWHNSTDFLTQDSDASSEYYFKITPVTYANSTWTVETDNTVTIDDTTDYWQTGYIDLMSNSDFQDINYAIIETESALISDVIVTY